MTDEIDDALRRWARATDPAGNPLTGAEVRDAEAVPVALEAGPRAWLAAAAVVVVLALAGGTLWAATRDGDDPGRVTTATDPEPGPGPTVAAGEAVATQVVVDAPALDLEGTAIHQVGLEPDCGGDAGDGCGDHLPSATARPLRTGTSLAWSEPLPADSPWLLSYARWECPPLPGDAPLGASPSARAGTGACGRITPEGQPDGDGDGSGDPGPGLLAHCAATFTVGHRPTRVVLRVTVDGEGEPACTVVAGDPPPLTIPPAFTLRDPRPWSCGTGAWDAGWFVGPSDPDASEAALACLEEAAVEGLPTELPTTELQPNDAVRPAWWRVTPGPGGTTVDVIRGSSFPEGPWTAQRCTGVERPLEHLQGTGCLREVAMSLDLPPLDAPAPDLPTDPDPDGEPFDVVVEAGDLPSGEEGSIHRVAVVVGAEVVAGGQVTPFQSTLIAQDVDGPVAAMELRWERYDCPGTCPPVDADGYPFPLPAPDHTCTARVEGGRGLTVVLALDGDACRARTATSPPPLTVPPAWSLREPFDMTCGTDTLGIAAPYPGAPDPSEGPRRCLLQAHREGREVELAGVEEVDGAPRAVVWRVGPDGVTRTWPAPEADEPAIPWLTQACTGLEEAPAGEWIRATGCGPQEVMSTDRP